MTLELAIVGALGPALGGAAVLVFARLHRRRALRALGTDGGKVDLATALAIPPDIETAAFADTIERAMNAQMAVEVWQTPLNGYWRPDQRITAVMQRIGAYALVPAVRAALTERVRHVLDH